MKLALQHKKCLFSQAPCLFRTTRQVKIDQKHPIAKMTPFIQILMMFLLVWREVIPLMAVLIPTKTQGKQSLVKWALVASSYISLNVNFALNEFIIFLETCLRHKVADTLVLEIKLNLVHQDRHQ